MMMMMIIYFWSRMLPFPFGEGFEFPSFSQQTEGPDFFFFIAKGVGVCTIARLWAMEGRAALEISQRRGAEGLHRCRARWSCCAAATRHDFESTIQRSKHRCS